MRIKWQWVYPVIWGILYFFRVVVDGAPLCSQVVLNALAADDAREIERFSIIGENMDCLEPKLKESILISAIKARSTSIAGVLIQRLAIGAPQVDERDRRGSTALHLCAVLGFSDLMKQLLDRGADVTAGDALKKTALHLGVASLNVTKLLLSVPSRHLSVLLQAGDVDGNTALHLALDFNYPSSAKMIVSSSEDDLLRLSNNVGQTPLHFCTSVDIARTLASRGVNLAARDNAGAVPLHRIAGLSNSTEVLAFLVAEGGGPVSVRDKENATPLHYACAAGIEANVKWLIDNGVNVEVVDTQGSIALIRGMIQGHLNLVKLFTDGAGSTPLHAGVETQRLDVIKSLIEDEGFDVNTPDTRTGQSAIFPAASAGLLEIVSFLADQKADLATLDKAGWSVLGTAIRSGQPAVAKILLERGANASQTNLGQRTALHEAAERGDGVTVQELLKRGVSVNAQDHLMRTALHEAAKGAPSIVDVLLLNGALELPMRDGRMPLHIAAGEGGQKYAAERLLRSRHDVDARESEGDTPLMLASLHGHLSIVQLLLMYCADIRALNRFQRAAADYAQDSETAELLESAGVMEGRCQCDCGPYQAGPQFRTYGWSGGCSGMVMCRTGDGAARQKVVCLAPKATEADEATVANEISESVNNVSVGKWAPSAPGLNCLMAVSHAVPNSHVGSLAIFVVIVGLCLPRAHAGSRN